MAHLVLRGWLAGAGPRPITVIKAIKDCTGKTLGAAKHAYDDCLRGEIVVIHDLCEDKAQELYKTLQQLSFRVEWQES